MTFYHAANASKSVKLPDGRRATFEVYQFFGGAWLGVAAVEDETIIAGLTDLTRQPKSGITEITEEKYRSCLKKKAGHPNSRLSLASQPPPQAQPVALIDRAGLPAVVVEGKSAAPAPVPTAAPQVFDDLDSVLQIGAVKTLDLGKSATLPAPATRDEGERSKRSMSYSSRQPKHRTDDSQVTANPDAEEFPSQVPTE